MAEKLNGKSGDETPDLVGAIILFTEIPRYGTLNNQKSGKMDEGKMKMVALII